MVPVLATGFKDLKTRISMQDEQHKIHVEKLGEVSERINELLRGHHGQTLVRINEAKRRQKQLAHRVLKLMRSVQVLRNRGYALHPLEEQLINIMETMARDLEKPSVFRGRFVQLTKTQ
jgi:nuclear pore complex protein Nup54